MSDAQESEYELAIPEGGSIDGSYIYDADGRMVGQFTEAGVGGWRALAARGAQSVKNFFGRGNPTKLNNGGLSQPYDATTGQFLSYTANSGFQNSQAAAFGTGVVSGFGEGYMQILGPPPIGGAGNLGHRIGYGVGAALSIYK